MRPGKRKTSKEEQAYFKSVADAVRQRREQVATEKQIVPPKGCRCHQTHEG